MTILQVSCDCGGLKAEGTWTVVDRHLVLSSPFGENRVLLGVQEPRKLAAKLLKNLCARAAKDGVAHPGRVGQGPPSAASVAAPASPARVTP